MKNVIIEYYTKDVYGNSLDYIKNPTDKNIISALTGQKTINAKIRNLLHELSRGEIIFKKVLQ